MIIIATALVLASCSTSNTNTNEATNPVDSTAVVTPSVGIDTVAAADTTAIVTGTAAK